MDVRLIEKSPRLVGVITESRGLVVGVPAGLKPFQVAVALSIGLRDHGSQCQIVRRVDSDTRRMEYPRSEAPDRCDRGQQGQVECQRRSTRCGEPMTSHENLLQRVGNRMSGYERRD